MFIQRISRNAESDSRSLSPPAGSACTPCSRFTHRKVKSSPGDNVGRKVGRRPPFAFLKVFARLFQKAAHIPGAEPWSPSAGGELPLNGIFFLLSFFFCACYGQKKKRRSYFADIVSVCPRRAPPAAGASPRPTITVPKKKRRSPSGDIVSVKRVPTDQ